MIVGKKDIFKMLGVFILAACAVFVCTLFFNYNADLKGIENLILEGPMQQLYQALLMTGKVVCAVSGGCLLLTTVVMLFFYIKQYIDSHRKELGILKALGYSDWNIAKGFWRFGFSVLLGTAAGYAGAWCLMPQFYAVQNEEHLLPEFGIHFHPVTAFCLTLLPAAFFALLSVFYGYLRLKTPVLALLKERENGKAMSVKPHAGHTKESEQPFLKELGKSTLRSRKTLVFFIAFASFCYADMVQMSASMKDLSSFMMAAMMFGIGILLAVVTLFLAVTTVLGGNRKTIALMRAFGYSFDTCRRAILGGYRPVAYIGFAVGTVYQYVLLRIMVSLVFRNVENVPEYHFDVPVCLVTLLSFAVLYEWFLYTCANRIRKISVKEIMLDVD
ncbi:MAG: ABC transporter permease [Lachnospiraceae bacterium]|nr:ABC transporter permease [Lachnospiraceae bacterium]